MEWLEEGRALRTQLFDWSHMGRRCHLVRAPGEGSTVSGLGVGVGNFPPFHQCCSPALLEQVLSGLWCRCVGWSCFAERWFGHFPVLASDTAVRGGLYMFRV